MKKVMAAIVPLAGIAALLAAPNMPPVADTDVPQSASGHGSMLVGKHGDGAGFFLFDVTAGNRITGSLLFAAEDHHRYPHLIVRVDDIDDAVFRRRSVSFSGNGMLHDDPVFVTASAYDGEGAKRPDTFGIKCTDGDGKVVFETHGEVVLGDIVVGAVE